MEKSVYAVSDANRAIHSLVLTAWSEGVGSNWVGFESLTEVKPLLGIPEDIDVLAILLFECPVKTIGKGKPLFEIAHREHFGQPFV
jgi:nitroreductase